MAKSGKKASKKPSKKDSKKSTKKAEKKAEKKAVKKAAKKAAPTKKPASKKFLVIYHAPFDAMARMSDDTPEQRAAGMAMWRAWADRVGKKLTDLGAPLMNGKRIGTDGKQSPSSKEVAGYSLLQAEDLAEALGLLEGHPHISGWHPDATIEIHETMLLPGM
ncbi:MAG TPA: hypothetical protein VKR32_03440 [Puia sp.]|nr:hypothetical protein [Puia sp.]